MIFHQTNLLSSLVVLEILGFQGIQLDLCLQVFLLFREGLASLEVPPSLAHLLALGGQDFLVILESLEHRLTLPSLQVLALPEQTFLIPSFNIHSNQKLKQDNKAFFTATVTINQISVNCPTQDGGRQWLRGVELVFTNFEGSVLIT